MSRYFHPLFWDSTSHASKEVAQECCGITRRATTADRTAPNEKKTERAVTRYCFPFGMCSRRSVPSVGIEPFVVFVHKRLKQSSVGSTYADGAPKKE